MRNGLLLVLSLVIVAAAALAFRLPQLGRRPMHCDEANQAMKAGLLLETGRYDYDPQDHHGPSLYWLTLPALRLRGVESFAASSEADYRIVPVAFGVGMVLFASPLGRWAGAWPDARGRGADRPVAGHGLLLPRLHPGNAPGLLHLGGNRLRLALVSQRPVDLGDRGGLSWE